MPNQVQTPYSTAKQILADLSDTGALYDGAILKLLATNIPVGPTLDISAADAAEADFSGYAASSAIVWADPFYTPAGPPVLLGDAKLFVVGSAPTVFNTIYGWYVTNGGGTVLLFAKLLDTPVALGAEGQGLEIIPAIPAYAMP